MNFSLTPGNIDDRAVVENLVDKLQAWLFGDRGYIGKKLTQSLANQDLELITKIKSNMKERISKLNNITEEFQKIKNNLK